MGVAALAAADAVHALAFQAQNLGVFCSWRDLDGEALAVCHADGLIDPKRRFKEIHFQGIGNVGAIDSQAAAAVRIAAFKKIIEGAARASLRTGATGPVHARTGNRVAHGVDFAAVVAAALFGIRQNVIGDRQFLEAVFRLGIVRRAVGMMLARQFAVGFFDILGACVARHAKGVIRVSHSTIFQAPSSCRQARPEALSCLPSIITVDSKSRHSAPFTSVLALVGV